jgi:hypothetical protein
MIDYLVRIKSFFSDVITKYDLVRFNTISMFLQIAWFKSSSAT